MTCAVETDFRTQNSYTRRRAVFAVGDWVMLKDGRVAKLDGIFIHAISGPQRMFAVASFTNQLRSGENSLRDTLLEVPLLQVNGQRGVVGLPAITSRRIWVVPCAHSSQLMWVDWDIYFM